MGRSKRQTSDPSRRSPGAWALFRWLASRDWWSWDLLFGAVVGVLVGAGATLHPPIRGDGATGYLFALAATFVAMLGVVMAVMAILIGLMSSSYRSILEAMKGGIRRAMNPYFIVAFGSVGGALISLIGALSWPALLWWSKVLLLGLCSGAAAWVLSGSAQLLIVTFNHGTDSASVARHQAAIRAAREDRLRQLGG